MLFMPSMNSRTLALLAIVVGLVVLCLGIWYIWNAQQSFHSEMQYVRTQCDSLQKHIAHRSTAPPMAIVDAIETNVTADPVAETAPTVEAVVHRSFATDTVGVPEESDTTDDTDDNDTDDDFNDDDQDVDTTDLVEGTQGATPQDIAAESVSKTNDTESTNLLVESLLSSMVKQVDDNSTTESANVDNASSESVSVEDFVESTGNHEALADILRKKTVVELKKMCAEHEIGIKKGKTFKRKEELIEELVDKLPQPSA